MSTDLGLLELAAKAVGIEYDAEVSRPHPKSGAFWGLWLVIKTEPLPNQRRYWNPLTNDGDALRLLAALPSLWSLSLKFGAPSIVMDVAWGFKGIKVTKFNGQGTDRAAVIRRAIVEAAAEIAKATEKK